MNAHSCETSFEPLLDAREAAQLLRVHLCCAHQSLLLFLPYPTFFWVMRAGSGPEDTAKQFSFQLSSYRCAFFLIACRKAALAITATSAIATATQSTSASTEPINKAATNVPIKKTVRRKPPSHIFRRATTPGRTVAAPCGEGADTTIWKLFFNTPFPNASRIDFRNSGSRELFHILQ